MSQSWPAEYSIAEGNATDEELAAVVTVLEMLLTNQSAEIDGSAGGGAARAGAPGWQRFPFAGPSSWDRPAGGWAA